MRLLPTVAILALLTATPAFAQMPGFPAPDDVITLDLSTEGFVATKTAKVSVAISMAASDDRAASLRNDMQKAMKDLVDADWRLTSFNRNPDQSGLTRWDASYEARLPESALGGLNDRAKKLSKPGMQLTINYTDFTPTLAEVEARKAELRNDLYKRAQDELARLNSTLPGRGYRISDISFNGMMPMAAPQPMMMKAARAQTMAAPMMADASAGGGVEVSQDLTVTAHVTYAAKAPAAAPATPLAKP